ncbi:MAG: autotransporter-associated beta strand repeat-containing protein, partial [Kiritimatiellae bacterium]|nr:autotransporter-associated beta strand repeat-containing protein [Kiritimatiellia bacterium]
SLPSSVNDVTTVTNRGKLFIDCGYAGAIVGALNLTTVKLEGGSYLGLCRLRATGSATTFNASGESEIHVESGNGNNGQDYGYISHLTLADGSFVSGGTFRTGYEASSNTTYLVATGSAPVRISQPIVVLRGHNSSANTAYTNLWEWAVADITGDTAPDLFLDGELQNYLNDSFSMRPILKTGAGTVRLGAANSYTGSVEIAEGTVLLGADGAFNSGIGVTLEGGTLDAGGTTNVAGTLTVDADSTLALPGGTALAFADSSAALWGDARLTITSGVETVSLRIGTDDRSLTQRQLNRIRWNGDRVALDANGYLKTYIPGMTVIIR